MSFGGTRLRFASLQGTILSRARSAVEPSLSFQGVCGRVCSSWEYTPRNFARATKEASSEQQSLNPPAL